MVLRPDRKSPALRYWQVGLYDVNSAPVYLRPLGAVSRHLFKISRHYG